MSPHVSSVPRRLYECNFTNVKHQITIILLCIECISKPFLTYQVYPSLLLCMLIMFVIVYRMLMKQKIQYCIRRLCKYYNSVSVS